MLDNLVAAVAKTGRITAGDVLSFRQTHYHDGKISAAEADAIFAANDACTHADPSWSIFFTEAMCDYVVHQMEPHGHVSEANSQWLLQHIDANGKVATTTELDLLVAILEQAKTVPERLSTYALNQVKHAVITGEGPLRSGKTLKPGMVDDADVELLRRILYAYAGGDNIAVTTEEAEVLFDINDATVDAANQVAWNDLFAKAIANHLMFASNHAAVSRTEALRRDEWVDNVAVNPGSFITGMVKSLRDIYKVATFKETDAQKSRREAYFGAAKSAEEVTEAEGQWLASRINRDGKMSAAERAALLFIKQEAMDIHPALLPLLDKVA